MRSDKLTYDSLDETASSANDPNMDHYARVLSQDVDRPIDHTEYTTMVARARDFTWLVDGAELGDGRAIVYREGMEVGQLSSAEFKVLQCLVQNKNRRLRPEDILPRSDVTKTKKLLIRARALCEPAAGRSRCDVKTTRSLKTHGRGEDVQYMFAPPKEFAYCVIAPLEAAAARATVNDSDMASASDRRDGNSPPISLTLAPSLVHLFAKPPADQEAVDVDRVLLGASGAPARGREDHQKRDHKRDHQVEDDEVSVQGVTLSTRALKIGGDLEIRLGAPLISGKSLLLPARVVNLTGRTKVIRSFVLNLEGKRYPAKRARRVPRSANTPTVLTGRLLSIGPRKILEGILAFKRPIEMGKAVLVVDMVREVSRSASAQSRAGGGRESSATVLRQASAEGSPPPKTRTPNGSKTPDPTSERAALRQQRGKLRLKKPSR